MTHSAADFYLSQLKPLYGAKVTDLIKSKDGYYGLMFTLPNGSRKCLWLLSDDEGNAPGSFELTEA